MQPYKKLWYYLLLLLLISLTIIVLDNFNTGGIEISKVAQDINSGVIGAILVAM